MRRLAPNLFDRRFDDLLEAGRSRLPSLAPRWTDHNVHDPGITLMELLAWIGEAQLYSLARMRRDERAAYAALLGLNAQGPSPARGSLWPDRTDRDSPASTFRHSVVIEDGALVRTTASEMPTFHPTHRVLWTPGRVLSLRTRLADGTFVDQTRTNEHGDRAFEPFGPAAGPADVLRLEFAVNGDHGLFPVQRVLADGALWPVGVRVDAPAIRLIRDASSPELAGAVLAVALRLGTERIELPVVDDGTRGFMQSGVLLLDVAGVPGSPKTFTIEIAAARGFPRPPRILSIEPGVLPIVQGGQIANEAHASQGTPGQRFKLAVPGLRFGPAVPDTSVEVLEGGQRRAWRRVADLRRSGPTDLDYELDTANETLVFGNGINGHLPPFESAIFVDYPYCDGAAADTPRNQRWVVRGIAGVFGVNPEAVSGGTNASSDTDLRREARHRLLEAHPLITAADIEAAARKLGDLEVARAKVLAIAPQADEQREITLIALRARASADEPADPPETPRWLAAVRGALRERIPLGTRLTVRAPGYRTFTVNARIEVQPRRNPQDVEDAARKRLRDAFTLTPRGNLKPRDFGTPVTARDLAGLIRSVAGVSRVAELTMSVDGVVTPEHKLKRTQLARIDLRASQIAAARAPLSGAR